MDATKHDLAANKSVSTRLDRSLSELANELEESLRRAARRAVEQDIVIEQAIIKAQSLSAKKIPPISGVAWILSVETRERVFEPMFEEMMDEYLCECGNRGAWSRRWLYAVFAIRTVVMAAECLWVAMVESLKCMIFP